MHDFGGPTEMGLAIRHPELVKRIVSINGPTPVGPHNLIKQIIANASLSPWFQWIIKAENEGILEQVLGHLDYNILSTLKLNGFERNEIIAENWIRAYRSPFQSSQDTLGAVAWAKGFATNEHIFESPDDKTEILLSQKPSLAIWGQEDKTLNHKIFLPLFKQAFPNGQTHLLPGVGHYSLEDAPKYVGKLVMDFIQTN